MKYNKEFKKLMETDHVLCNLPDIPSVLISYDRWKQCIKAPSMHFSLNWRLYLAKECGAVDSAIFEKRSSCWRCFFGMPRASRCLSDSEKVRVCEINKRTLYKICKKIDKRLLKKGSEAKAFYTKAVTEQSFRFLSSKELVRLRIAASSSTGAFECPVCFDELDTKCVITRCGHAFCKACALRMWHLGNDGLDICSITTRLGERCPVCRALVAVKA